jgi:hypothetical protein
MTESEREELNRQFNSVIDDAITADQEAMSVSMLMHEAVMRGMLRDGTVDIRFETNAQGQRLVTIPEPVIGTIIQLVANELLPVIEDSMHTAQKGDDYGVAMIVTEPLLSPDDLKNLAIKMGFIALALAMNDNGEL